MTNPTREDVDLVLRLYEQRRERVLRRARDWFFKANLNTFADVQAVMSGASGPKANQYFRQVTSYWEMICALMNSGAISAAGCALFVSTTREFFLVYTKLQPHLKKLRAATRPGMLLQLETFCKAQPDHKTLLPYFKKLMASNAAYKKDAATPKKKD